MASLNSEPTSQGDSYEWSISGMDCGSCTAKIRDALRRLPGVSDIEIGLSYAHIIQPLPPSEVGAAGGGRKVRLVQGIFRLKNTAALRMDVGRGMSDIPLRQIGEDEVFEAL